MEGTQNPTAEAMAYARNYAGSFGFMVAMREAVEQDRPFSPRMIEAVLRCKAKEQHPAEVKRTPVTQPGMYRSADGTMYKVQRSREGDRLYAKRLVHIGGRRLNKNGEVVRIEFQYEGGAVYRLSAEDRLSYEDAKAFGIQYGVCIVCGAWLKDARSVAEGIGPVCRERI